MKNFEKDESDDNLKLEFGAQTGCAKSFTKFIGKIPMNDRLAGSDGICP
jgi:hypothetical protein